VITRKDIREAYWPYDVGRYCLRRTARSGSRDSGPPGILGATKGPGPSSPGGWRRHLLL